MKIKIIDIIALCNFTHPDFGTFAKYLSGLADKDGCIDVPTACTSAHGAIPSAEAVERPCSGL